MRRVAVTGFGVVSPIGVGREAFWSALEAGRSGIGKISRFDCTTFGVQLAGEVRERLGLPPEVAQVAAEDPKIGFAYAACAEALAAAGIGRLDKATLLHLGTSLETFDLNRVARAGGLGYRAFAESERSLQVPLDTAAGLVAERFGRPGHMLTNCSACAASAQAIGHGFRNVRTGRCETAVCGGFDSMINPLGVGGFQLLGALTTDNDRGESACRPFDSSRSGTVLGEGAAVLVLEPLDRARAEGRPVLAEVCGYGSTLDAHGLSAPDPEGHGAERAMRSALADAGLEPFRIGHINAHGTGTRLNDEIEAAAIRRVFAGGWERVPVSATKSVTGHLIGAAGAAEAGACLFALGKRLAPANPWLKKVASGCELDHVTGTARPFDGEYALSNSFGFGGQNASLIFRRHHG
jgi:3-oxoacyl-[acyl-carrier-protein] synthase II